ncbi:hypothetical protein TeGR_g11567 [Tetraparma gracilis]|uniref:Tubulin-tyrosine ligase n=1 Tax=Tetraparma gracilis TaxID=2962635 RepID=A0ABQ6MKW3_9STRA|nr:hypothetical protein TeGR_g11567 [Tetraparma gracilis]
MEASRHQPLHLHPTTSFSVLHPGPPPPTAASAPPPGASPSIASSYSPPSPLPAPTFPNVFLDINEPYTLSLIQSIFLARQESGCPYSISLGPCAGSSPITPPAPCTFQLSEYERVAWAEVLAGELFTSNYCVRKGMSRKAQLALFVRRHVAKHPGSCLGKAVPHTIVVETWAAFEEDAQVTLGDGVKLGVEGMGLGLVDRLKECAAEVAQTMDLDQREDTTYILKPSTTNKGAGICLIYCLEQLLDKLAELPDIREWVVQEYVPRPLLLRKRKFHIRAYVLAVSAIQVYFYDEVLVLCAGTAYDPDATSLFGHITNTAYQAVDPGFVEEECVMLLGDVARILLEEGRAGSAEEAGAITAKILEDMQAVTGELWSAFKNEQSVYSPLPGCWEHSGLDFLVDEDYNVVLLETNPGPDFKQTGSRLNSVVRNMFEETIDLTLGGVPFDKERNGSAFTKVFDCKVRGGGGAGEIRMRLIGDDAP